MCSVFVLYFQPNNYRFSSKVRESLQDECGVEAGAGKNIPKDFVCFYVVLARHQIPLPPDVGKTLLYALQPEFQKRIFSPNQMTLMNYTNQRTIGLTISKWKMPLQLTYHKEPSSFINSQASVHQSKMKISFLCSWRSSAKDETAVMHSHSIPFFIFFIRDIYDMS